MLLSNKFGQRLFRQLKILQATGTVHQWLDTVCRKLNDVPFRSAFVLFCGLFICFITFLWIPH